MTILATSFLTKVCRRHLKKVVNISHRSKFYDRDLGVPLEWMKTLSDSDLTLKGIENFAKRQMEHKIEQEQRFSSERHHILGPDLAAATFILNLGGAAKFVGKDTWFRKTDNTIPLPRKYRPGLKLEGLDASNTKLTYIGLDNLTELDCLSYLNLSECKYVDDWWINRLYEFRESLEVIDLSGCKRLSERGLMCFHHLENLKAIKLSNMEHIENLELVSLLLQDTMPGLQIIGVKLSTTEDRSPSAVKAKAPKAEVPIPQARTIVGEIAHLAKQTFKSKFTSRR